MSQPTVHTVKIQQHNGQAAGATEDLLAVEEPLEIRLGFGPEDNREQRSLAVTMRTPGHDFDLAAGFLLGEGILKSTDEVVSISYCGHVDLKEEEYNVVKVELQPGVEIDFEKLSRHFYTTSSCGVCGKASIEAVCEIKAQRNEKQQQFSKAVINGLDDTIRKQQVVFKHTGGIHAAALFDNTGKLLCVREDIGRHNAVDKMIGAMTYAGADFSDKMMWVSGRAGFELVQKAVVAGIPLMAAVGAPSSLAVQLAQEYGMTLLGFVRNGRFNVYSGAERLA